MISLSNVGKEYRKGQWALRDVTFTIQKGEFVILSGTSGAGKTTLMRLVSLEERPTEGQLTLEGFASNQIKKRQLPYFRRRIGLVFQDFRLLRDRSAYENIALVLRATGAKQGSLHRRVIRALAAVGLSGRGDAMPHELSGGEQQRIGIARAIVGDPFIVLADEPTGNLDDANKREVFQMLKKISSAGTAVLIATHDLTIAREMRARTLILDKGRLVRDALQPAQAAPAGGPVPIRPIAAGGLRA